MTERGFYDATTDEQIIRRWFSAVPLANIGIPTGKRSGFFVLDVDRDEQGFRTLATLIAEYGELPVTATAKTGGGGRHYMFRYPAGDGSGPIRNSAGKLGPGLDVRGEGGYIIAPPSCTDKGPYELLKDLLPSDPPAWLLECLRTPQRVVKESARPSAPSTVSVGPIPEGTRNTALASIGGKLRARGHDRVTIFGELLAINAAQCEPPLDEGEVEKIALSIARYESGNSSPEPSPETLEILSGIEASQLWGREWRGMAGKSERDVYAALLNVATQYGQLIPAGVRVSISLRALALAAALSKRATDNAVKRLRDAGLIRRDGTGTGTRSGAFVLLPRAKVAHSTTIGESRERENSTSGLPLRAPRLRWSAPEIRRLGKTCGAVLDALDRTGGSATLSELAGALGIKRPRDLRRRVVSRLVESGVVECSGNTVALSGDWLAALNREREAAGEIAALRRDMARYARERDAYRNRNRVRPEPTPQRSTAELVRVPDPPAADELYALMARQVPVRTVRGEGQLWQVFSDRVGVILDASPNVVSFFGPGELVGAGTV